MSKNQPKPYGMVPRGRHLAVQVARMAHRRVAQRRLIRRGGTHGR
jgi:hypothetical protein